MGGHDTVLDNSGKPILVDYCTVATCSLQYAQISYLPNVGVNAAYAAIFGILLVLQIVQFGLYRTWGYSIGMVCGLILEILGYAARIELHSAPFDFNWFVIYIVCLTIAPAFISASIYLCLSRLVIVHGAHVAPVKPVVYTVVFIICDFISLLLQSAGGAISATTTSGHTGIHLMMGGLAFQVASLTFFALVCADLVRRYRAVSTRNPIFARLRQQTLFKLLPYALLLSGVTILARSVFRVAELKDGFGGKLANNQVLFCILEGPMIIVAGIALTALHPGLSFKGQWKEANIKNTGDVAHNGLHESYESGSEATSVHAQAKERQ